MITVVILINGQPLVSRSAKRITNKKIVSGLKGKQKYKCDDGTIIDHNYEDRAIVLAKKMLDTIDLV